MLFYQHHSFIHSFIRLLWIYIHKILVCVSFRVKINERKRRTATFYINLCEIKCKLNKNRNFSIAMKKNRKSTEKTDGVHLKWDDLYEMNFIMVLIIVRLNGIFVSFLMPIWFFLSFPFFGCPNQTHMWFTWIHSFSHRLVDMFWGETNENKRKQQ